MELTAGIITMALKKIDLSESAAGEEDPGAGIELTKKPPAGKAGLATSQHDDEPIAAREPPPPPDR